MAAPTSAPLSAGDTFWADADRHLIRYAGAGAFIREIIDHAAGSFLFTEDGRQILDFTSGQMSAILGHSHPEIVATVTRQAAKLDHLFSGMLSRPVVDLARRLAGTLPEPLEKALLLTTGAESNEAAIRMAKLVTGKHEIVSFTRSWHGMTQAAAGATYSAGRKGYGPAVDRQAKRSSDELGAFVTRRCLELGLHMNIVQLPGMGGVFRIAPPLTATEDELSLGLAILDQAISDATGQL